MSALAMAVGADFGKVLAGCRSGSRSPRDWALAEVSRSGGAAAAVIASVLKAAGYSADDLNSDIMLRIAKRAPMPLRQEQ